MTRAMAKETAREVPRILARATRTDAHRNNAHEAAHSTNDVLSGTQLVQAIETAVSRLPEAFAQPLSLERLLQCVTLFARRLAQREIDLPLSEAQRKELLSYCDSDALLLKVDRELGEHPFHLHRIDYREARFEAWRPLGCVLHVMPANAPLLPFLAVLESLLVGNVNWVRLSSDDHLSAKVLRAFVACDDSATLERHVVVWRVSRDEVVRLLPHVDGVSAWGGDDALSTLRNQMRPGCRWIAWGHKISFIYVATSVQHIGFAELDAVTDAICRLDQQTCSSPQLVLVDSEEPALLRRLGQALALSFKRRAAAWPAITPDIHQAADIGAAVSHARLAQAFERQQGEVWEGGGWRIIWKHEIALEASPLFRTLLLRPMPRVRLQAALLPWRPYLQTCGLVCAPTEAGALARQLVSAGVGRITTPRHMHESYIGEPHDDVRALVQLARRVSVSLPPQAVDGHARLDPDAGVGSRGAEHGPVMDRASLAGAGYGQSARLFFRSGGSTGKPLLSAYSYRDYHRQMRATAAGLLAAGLDPGGDRVLNLLRAGNLYGGMLSSFLAMEKMGVAHFPMGSLPEDGVDDIVDLMAEHGINTVIGIASSINLLFQRAEQRLRAYGGVRKVFYSGEFLSQAQRRFIEGFGVGVIRSAIYGSNDAGPIGHACPHCEDGVFHLMTDVQQIDIVGLENNRPVAPGVTGRLLVTSLAREAQRVERYDIGDLARKVDGDCPCGLPTPRFQLMGRHDHLVRISTHDIDQHHLTAHLDMPAQFVISAQDGIDLLVAHVDGDVDLARSRLEAFPPIRKMLGEGHARLDVRHCPQPDFEYSAQSGKAAIFIDRRDRPGAAHGG